MSRTIAEIAADIRSNIANQTKDFRSPDWRVSVDKTLALRAELHAAVGQPASLPITIDGQTRDVPVRWLRADLASTDYVALARVGRSGTKLWPVQLTVHITDAGTFNVSMETNVPGQRSRARVCFWADDARAAKHESASIHANGTSGDATREKARATRAAK